MKAVIGDEWKGTPLPALSWQIKDVGHVVGWTSSLDYRSSFESVCIAEYGGLDQGGTYWYGATDRIVSQRPALHLKKVP